MKKKSRASLVSVTGRREWRWHSAADRTALNRRGWKRVLTRTQYLYIEFSCGHWERADLVRPTKLGRHWCEQCQSGRLLVMEHDQRESIPLYTVPLRALGEEFTT